MPIKAAHIFEEIILVMDCCREVTWVNTISQPELILPTGSVPDVRWMYAYVVPRGGAAREEALGTNGETGSIFTHRFLNALRHTAPDANGMVTATAVKMKLHTEWPKELGFQPSIDVPYDFTLFTNAAVPVTQVRITIDPSLPASNVVIIQNNSFQEVCRFPIVQQHASGTLTDGIYYYYRSSLLTKIIGSKIDEGEAFLDDSSKQFLFMNHS